MNAKPLVASVAIVLSALAGASSACETVICANKYGDWEVIETPAYVAARTKSDGGAEVAYICSPESNSCGWGFTIPGLMCKAEEKMLVALEARDESKRVNATCFARPAKEETTRGFVISGTNKTLSLMFFKGPVTIHVHQNNPRIPPHRFSNDGAGMAVISAHEALATLKAQTKQ